MTSAAQMAIWSAIVLAMAGTFFGVCVARMIWADDLIHARTLGVNWEKSRTAMESTIDSLNRTIISQNQIINIQKRRLGE